jgi:hypothetical protein
LASALALWDAPFAIPSGWLKMVQSKIVNYAKQSQFSKKSNVYNRNFNNELQRKMQIGHLVKTNPNKANFQKPKKCAKSCKLRKLKEL